MIPEPYNYILLAFSIDFEGSIQLRLIKSKKDVLGFRPYISIPNTSKELLEGLIQKVGIGHITNGSFANPKRARQYLWQLRTTEIRDTLLHIEPYLIAKREQALMLLKSLKILKTREFSKNLKKIDRVAMYSYEEFQELMFIHSRLKKLNIRPSYQQIELTDAEKLLIEFRKRGT